jgi:DUF1365 family protein
MHARHDALARRAFRYPVYIAALDLDELPALDRGLRLFSYRKRNVFALDDRDYETGDLRGGLTDLLAANGVPAPHATRLVTNLRVAGYVFNPISFFLNYDAHGELASVIAEVNNTYGGRRRYVLGPAQQIGPATFRHVRELFVSPFLHGDLTYEFAFDAPLDGAHLAIDMHVHDQAAVDATARSSRPGYSRSRPRTSDLGPPQNPTTTLFPGVRSSKPEAPMLGSTEASSGCRFEGAAGLAQHPAADHAAPPHAGRRVFTARLSGARTPLSDRALLAAAVRYPLMTAQVIGLIHWQALKLRLRGVPYRRPGPDHRPLRGVPRQVSL